MPTAQASQTINEPASLHLVHPRYRPDIDGLRALGVLLVVAFHAFPKALPGGFVGVDIFFVVSGFLISTIIFGSLENNSFSFQEFYARRVRRIFPALAIVLATGWAIGWYMLLVDEQQQLGLHIAAGAGFVANFVLWSEAGYFDSDAYTKPLLHLWSLGIEEQFYIVWPLLLALVWRRRTGFLAITIAIAIASFAANILTVGADAVAAFYAPWSRFWELMTGGILAYLSLHPPAHPTRRADWRSAAGLIMILVAVALLDKKSAFPGWWALLPTLGTFLIIGAGPNAWLNRKFLSSRGMVWVGLISYPLYLWHWLLLSFAWIARGKMPPSSSRAILVAASFVLAYLTYLYVEKPIRTGGRRSAVVLAATMGFLLLAGLATYAEWVRPRNDDRNIGLILEAIQDWEYPAGFDKSSFNGVSVRSRKAGERNVLFIGDSHLQQYSPRVVALLERDPTRYPTVLFLTSPGCSPIPGSAQVNVYHVERCTAFRQEVERLAADPAIDRVVVGGAWNLYFLGANPQYGGDIDLESEIGRISAFLKTLTRDKKVFFVLDNPSGRPFEPRNFFTGSRLTSLTVKPFQERIPWDQGQAALHARLAAVATAAGAVLIDPAAHLCPENRCRAFTPDAKPVYKDDNHYRASYVREQAVFVDGVLAP
ncbi:acyltransferase family protein [Accumulibacter sp.]|uniref:acyltransferase family protein n=1 Tax=Accumulibacter sp. TaxID=2053492 RepID=UPI00262DBC72|nr:acyltransferase family protein [Accumulibacter sp.]